MTAYYNNKDETKVIKQFIKPQPANKLSNPKEKLKEGETRTLPIRGQ